MKRRIRLLSGRAGLTGVQTHAERQLLILLCLGVATAALVAVPAASYGHAHKHRPRPAVCRLGGSHGRGWRRLVADGEAEVYRGPGAAQTEAFFGCVYGGRPSWLGLVPDGGHEEGLRRAYHIVLNGSMVALESAEFGYVGEHAASRLYVMVVDLRHRRVVHKVPTGRPPQGPFSVGSGEVRSMVVKEDGAVAWIADDFKEFQRTEAPYNQVHVLDKNGERVLASGNHIAGRTLALAGSTIYWTQEGEAKSASLE